LFHYFSRGSSDGMTRSATPSVLPLTFLISLPMSPIEPKQHTPVKLIEGANSHWTLQLRKLFLHHASLLKTEIQLYSLFRLFK